MGTQYRIIVRLKDDELIEADNIEKELIDAMQSVNNSMSTYIPESELNKLNNASTGKPIELSSQLHDVIQESQAISKLSEGAFDITLGKVVNLWGFGKNGKINKAPTEQVLTQMIQSVGYQKIELRDSKLTKTVANISLDLSAIAKGYAVDKVAERLDDLAIENYLIDIGGELKASGFAQFEQVWKVGIEKPHALGGIQQIIALHDKSIATSGDYRNFHVIEGTQYSHTIDVKTLKPVFHRLALVSVIDERASRADALATAVMALGDERGWNFAQKHDLTVYMVVREEGENNYRVQMTESFKEYLQ